MKAVLDADFLSSFLKIQALHTIRDYYRADTLLVPPAVFREVAVTSLLPQLTTTEWLRVQEITEDALQAAATAGAPGFPDLGAGEREAIALAHHLEESVLLMNDKKALHHARKLGIRTVNVPAFLLQYRFLGDEAASHVRELVQALEEKDHYAFPEGIRARLVQQ